MIIPSMNVHKGIVLFMYASGIYGLFTHPLDKDITSPYSTYYSSHVVYFIW